MTVRVRFQVALRIVSLTIAVAVTVSFAVHYSTPSSLSGRNYSECPSGLEISVHSTNEGASYKTDHISSRPRFYRGQDPVGYWIASFYGGQMTRATKNMAVQQCLGGAMSKGFQIQIVEPFSQESQLLHSPRFWSKLEYDLGAARFSDYYDLNYYNNESVARGHAPLVRWEEFLLKAARETVVVVNSPQGCTNRELWHGKYCPQSDTCAPSSKYASLLTGLRRYGFSVIRMVCLACIYIKRPLTVDELHREIYGNRSAPELTVVFADQRNYGSVQTWIDLPEYCSLEDTTVDPGLIASSAILNHTAFYKASVLGTKRVVAVMFRIERLFESQSFESLLPCLSETIKLHATLGHSHSMLDASTFITLDIGRFGSEGMEQKRLNRKTGISKDSLIHALEEHLSHLYKDHWTLEAWEESFANATGGITERGYIAVLQQSIAAHSDCLILMGGGSYQQVAAHQFINYHKNTAPCLYTVCMKDRWATL